MPQPSPENTLKAPPHAAESATTAGKLLEDALGWAADNVGKPFLNAAVFTPWNAIASTTNLLSGHAKENPLLTEKTPYDLPKAGFCSFNWFSQNISGGLGMIAPYVIAGRMTGGAMRLTGEGLGLEGTAAEIMQNSHVAQIAGAGIYDSMRDPGQGETRLGNALSGAAGFTVYEFGNAWRNQQLNLVQRVGKRAVIGMVGASAQQTVSHLVSEQNLPTFDQYMQAAVSGGVLNVLLPPTQDAIMHKFDNFNHAVGRGVPIDHYLASHDNPAADSRTLHDLVAKNPWTRVQDGGAEDKADIKHKLVTLAGDHPDPKRLGHELFHLQAAKEAQIQRQYDQAADLLRAGQISEARELFFKTHLGTEVTARVTENQIAEELGTEPHLDIIAIARLVPDTESHAGHSYADNTEIAFAKFVQSKGNVRPGIEYGGVSTQTASAKGM